MFKSNQEHKLIFIKSNYEIITLMETIFLLLPGDLKQDKFATIIAQRWLVQLHRVYTLIVSTFNSPIHVNSLYYYLENYLSLFLGLVNRCNLSDLY